MRQKIIKLVSVMMAVCFIVGTSATVSAAIPTDSYTYWENVSSDRKSVYNKPMYDPSETLDAKRIGVDDFTKVSDVCTDVEDNVYILDAASRIVVLNSSFELVREINSIGGTEAYDEANSIYVYRDGTIYICDTVGKRVLHASVTGDLLETITLPESPLIPDDFNFAPTNVVLDEHNYLYVLSDGSYYGALLYSPEKEFLGFYGANEVKNSVTTVLNNIKNRIFPSNEKKANSVRTLPYCAVDIVADSKGFIYTCNGYTSMSDRTGQIRKLSPGTGGNILNSSAVNFVDTRTSNTEYKDFYAQDICSMAVDVDGFIYGLESRYGKVFVYDSSCRNLTSFGGGMGEGTQVGTFQNVSGLAVNSSADKIFVSDSGTNLITVFSVNEYGKEVKRLISLTLDGNYDEIKSGWINILEQDSNFQPAYGGLARVYLTEGDYKTAMQYAKKGYDRETYALAFEYIRSDFINRNFGLLFSVIIAVISGLIVLLVLTTKNKFTVIKNRKLHTMLTTPLHPAGCFSDIKEKQAGSIGLSLLLIALFYIATVLQTLSGGFLFTVYDPASFNSIWVLVRTAGLVILWIASNWLVCTLMGGNGTFKEITVVTSYSLTPLIVEKFIRLILTNALLPTEASFLNILDAVALIYVALLMIVGLLKIHDFSVGRLIGTSILSILGIAAIVFLIILIFILAQQFYGFIVTLVTEVFTL